MKGEGPTARAVYAAVAWEWESWCANWGTVVAGCLAELNLAPLAIISALAPPRRCCNEENRSIASSNCNFSSSSGIISSSSRSRRTKLLIRVYQQQR